MYDDNLGLQSFSVEAEQSVLGAILLNNQSLLNVMEILRPDYFYVHVNREIYSIFVNMFTMGTPIDIVTVLDGVSAAKIFESDAEAKIYLTDLANFVPTTTNIENYANILQEKYYIRSLTDAAREIIDRSSTAGNDARALLDWAEQLIYGIRRNNSGKGLQVIGEIIVGTYDRLQKIVQGAGDGDYLGIATEYKLLDNILMGLNKSDLILLAARPAMGKTAFALNIATNIALSQKKKVAIFSLEMSKEQLVTRILSYTARIPSRALKTGALEVEDWNSLAAAAHELSSAMIYIDDTANITVPEIKAKVRRLGGVDLVIIDYLQLMASSGRRNDNRVQEMSELTRSLKIMAKELNLPVLTLSQLSRSPDIRNEHEPRLSDLRESGSIEQDADVVMFLYRESYYNKACEHPNIAECIIAKNRHGETNKVALSWDGQYTKFENVEWNKRET
ncbi:MAG: replicative DNA helicase [Oscillospiraceae bacterium]|jgi:replicative DNA helicase|nr:replicative DNA helicase [Oscillospiraceae bacterium]